MHRSPRAAGIPDRTSKAMGPARPQGVTLALCLLFASLPAAEPALAQQKMTPEDQAIYRNMLKRMGADPATVSDASRQVDASRRISGGKCGVVDYHVVGVYEGRTNVSADGNWLAYADVKTP
jgi:hypothetical protein